ncbi:Kinesin-like protein KIN-14L [Durusdinium trenchii]|uniref:Kinesin-like protein KIN-14L n=1 Tax=Durusdinium trenchii TaxID=1381693 RepID=A0ABP0R873_9DINO
MDSRVFLFDDLFDGEATDDEIFSSIQDELDAAVAGEAVCILAYGATGSGKTHTVTQLAQRAAGELERQALAMSSGGIKLEITVQLVEIYNDQLRDLLAEGAQPRLRVSVSSSGSALLGAVSQCISSDSAGGAVRQHCQDAGASAADGAGRGWSDGAGVVGAVELAERDSLSEQRVPQEFDGDLGRSTRRLSSGEGEN